MWAEHNHNTFDVFLALASMCPALNRKHTYADTQAVSYSAGHDYRMIKVPNWNVHIQVEKCDALSAAGGAAAAAGCDSDGADQGTRACGHGSQEAHQLHRDCEAEDLWLLGH